MGFHWDFHWDFHVASWHVSCLLALLALLLGQGHKKYHCIFPTHFNFRQPEAARLSQSYESVKVFTGSRFQSAATGWSREQKHQIFFRSKLDQIHPNPSTSNKAVLFLRGFTFDCWWISHPKSNHEHAHHSFTHSTYLGLLLVPLSSHLGFHYISSFHNWTLSQSQPKSQDQKHFEDHQTSQNQPTSAKISQGFGRTIFIFSAWLTWSILVLHLQTASQGTALEPAGPRGRSPGLVKPPVFRWFHWENLGRNMVI